MQTFLKRTHPNNPIIAVDAAVGDKGDIGLIRILDTPLLPGAGANKKLGSIGDLSIMGIVAEKSLHNYGLLNTTRLNLVYTMSEILSDALSSLLWERCSKISTQKKA
jgi:putative sporulation protein YyaC